jgi:hypothetical protein
MHGKGISGTRTSMDLRLVQACSTGFVLRHQITPQTKWCYSDPKRMAQKCKCKREGCSKLASQPQPAASTPGSEQVHSIASFTQTQSSTCSLTGTRTFPFPAPTQAASHTDASTALHQARPHVLGVLQGRFGDIVTTRVCATTSTSGDLRGMGLGDTRIHKSQHLQWCRTKECP